MSRSKTKEALLLSLSVGLVSILLVTFHVVFRGQKDIDVESSVLSRIQSTIQKAGTHKIFCELSSQLKRVYQQVRLRQNGKDPK